MTIEITRPEVETLINQRLRTGGFKDAEDLVFQALQSPGATSAVLASSPKDMVELFAPLRGLNMNFESDRGTDLGRDIEL